MTRDIVITEDELPPQVLRAIELGRKVEAIKLLQDATGLGFANAKVLVDTAARRYAQKASHPGFVEEQTSLPALLRALLLVVAAFWLYRHYFGG
jgi:hypothetical protein